MATIVLNSTEPYLLTPATGKITVITNTDQDNDIIVGTQEGIYSAQPSGIEGGQITDPNVTVIEAAGGYLVTDGSWEVYGLAVPNPQVPTDNTASVSIQSGASVLGPGAITTATALITSGFALQMGEAVAIALGQSGVSFLAHPVPLYDTASVTPSPPIIFGTNVPTWTPAINAGVTGMAAANQYPAGFVGVTLVNGIPNTWPTLSYPGGITNEILIFQPDVATTLAGTNDARLTNLFTSAPNNSWIMPYREGNLKSSGLSGSQIQALDNHILPLVHAANATLKYGRGLSTYPVIFQGQDPTPFITPGMDFYSMDGYQGPKQSGATPDTIFGATLAAILKVQANALVGITETGSAVNMTSWLQAAGAYAQSARLFCCLPYFGTGPDTVQWNNSYAPAMNALSAALAGSGSLNTIGAGATVTLPPLSPSPVAGYATADSMSYDILVQLQAGAASTIPFCKVQLFWYDNDVTAGSGAIPVAQEQWLLPMGASAGNPTKIQGVGPQKAAYLQVKVVNMDTVACTAQVKINSVGRTVQRDSWRWECIGSPNVPTYTIAPDGGGNVLQLAGVVSRSCAPGTNTLAYLCSLYAGDVWVRCGTATGASVITAALTPQPSGVFNGTQLFNELITGPTPSGDFVDIVKLPRAPCLLTFSNSDTVAHNVFASIIESP